MSVEIEGFDKLIEKFETMAKGKKLTERLEDACLVVEDAARRKAPKISGELRRSIASKVEGEEGVVYTPLFYAPYVEYGTGLFAENGGRKDVPWFYQDDRGEWHSTSGIKPEPYMRPALYESREKILRILKEGLIDD